MVLYKTWDNTGQNNTVLVKQQNKHQIEIYINKFLYKNCQKDKVIEWLMIESPSSFLISEEKFSKSGFEIVAQKC